MDETRLRDAMRPGSRNPLEEREAHDMGRFGLGLKTASFSQCRILTVASRKNGLPRKIRRWDLDHVSRVGRWELLRNPLPESEQKIAMLDDMPCGTIVLWENIDRIVGDEGAEDENAHRRFDKLITQVKVHLGMVFHRYLDTSQNRLRIYLNGTDPEHTIQPWDPFMSRHSVTIKSPVERIRFGHHYIEVQGHILPHKDKLTPEEFETGNGPVGWNAQQGFYVYRNERLLVPGSWLNLGRERMWTKDDHFRLARIRLDLPNSMDSDWQIDIKKSTARPPPYVRARIIDLAEDIRTRARDVFVHRGDYGSRPALSTMERIWKAEERNGRRVYKIDRRHPLVKHVVNANINKEPVKALLSVIEETVPVEKIWLDSSEEKINHVRPFQDIPEEMERVAIQMYQALVRQCRINPSEAKNRIMCMEAFRDYRDRIAEMDMEGEN